VLLDTPSAGIVSEIFENQFGRLGEGVVAVVDGDYDAVFPESDDVALFVSRYVADETDMFLGTPSSGVVAKVFDRVEGLDAEAVTEDDNTIETKADDIREAWARGGNYRYLISIG
jgi:hypothetical protein